MALVVGTRLGPYEIAAAIGAGGMGEVYRATDTSLGRQVAIKVLPDAFAQDAERLARFEREAKTLASLNHPNIAAIYGLEESGGMTALVMELVEGDDLSQRLARGAIPIDEALPIAKQITEALEAAHEQGIIHRDLKPANIKVRSDGTVKVLDFGLAKAMEPVGAMAASNSMSPTITSPAMMTGVGMILGTAAYMSPEQARGKVVDKRADIWAFGAVLYEMLAGTAAFDGEDVTETLAAVVKSEPLWDALPDRLSPSLRVFLRRCLDKNPKDRLGDIRDMRLALGGAFEVGGAHAAAAPAPVKPLWKQLLPVGGALVIGVALGPLTLWRLSPAPFEAVSVARFAIPLGEGQLFTNTNRNVLALSPDGTQMVYVANRRLFLRSMSSLDARPLQGTEGFPAVTNPVFSPDGKSVVFYAANTLKKITTSGGVAITLCPAENPTGLSWVGDTIVFGQAEAGVFRVSSNGGRPEQLVTLKAGEAASGPQLLPDGGTVLFTLGRSQDIQMSGSENLSVVAQSLATGDRTTLIEAGADGRYLSTGHLVYVSTGVLLAVPFDVGGLTIAGAATPVVEGVRRGGGSAQVAISSTGTLAYMPGPAGAQSAVLRVARFDRQGAFEPLKIEPGSFEQPRLSPDGARLAFGSDDGKEATIWVYDLAGASTPRRLTFEGRNRFPVWSADGRRVAFQSDREGDRGIFWQSADGTGTAERLTKPDTGTIHVPESWSPDNARLLYNSNTNGMTALWVLSVADRKATPFGNVKSPAASLTGAVFSPDGRWVAYASRDGRKSSAVFVQPFPATGAKYQVSKNADDGHHPVWAMDGAELLFTPTSGNQLISVRIVTQPSFTVGEEVPLPRPYQNAAPSLVRPYDISRDGQHIVGFVTPDAVSNGAPEIRVVLNWTEELKRVVPTK